MKAVLLAAGYATRLYPLTLDRPKALLPVGGRPMLERLLERLADIKELGGVIVVSNTKFAGHFGEWARAYTPPRPELAPRVLDDGTSEEETKLGAIGDLALAVEQERLDDDLIVVAGDNLFSQSIGGFGEFCRDRTDPVVAVYDVGRLEDMHRYNSIELDEDGRVTFFEEKPAEPRSTLMAIALYYYPRGILPLIRTYLDGGNNPDQPGRLVEWLYPRLPVYSWRLPGRWYDIGSQETLRQADAAFSAS
jgi:glucose-1-phosphate thymidylyltransferase